MFSDATFTLYEDFGDTYNLLGHLYKVAAYYFLFKAAVGGASYPEESASVDELLGLADDRMYEQKRQMKEMR